MDCLGEPQGRAFALLTQLVLHTAENSEGTTLWERVFMMANFVAGVFGTSLPALDRRQALAVIPAVFRNFFWKLFRPAAEMKPS